MMTNWTRFFVIVVIVATTVSCDQISKAVVRKRIASYEQIRLIPNHVTLTKMENTGSFLSFGATLANPWRFILLTFLPVLALAGGLIVLFTRKQFTRIGLTGFCLVIGGGLGNIYDRVVYGSVTDFIHLRWGFLETGVFNFADVSIMIGIGILMVLSIRRKRPGGGVTSQANPE